MTLEKPDPAAADEEQAREGSDRAGPLESLREILVGGDRQRIAGLETQVEELERRVTDREALVRMIAPVLTELIRRRIRDAREEMVEALYPIIGQVVVRAVQESIRDLARTVDARMRSTFSPRVLWRRLRGRLSGVSGGEMALREALPFTVTDVLLIHRETGLLLRHVTGEPEALPDSDLVSGMLTAIRDFAGETLGQDRERDEDLDAIQYGDEHILIETSQYVYLAVVVEGVEPAGFRAVMREQVIEIGQTFEETLRAYDGDASALAPADERMRTLFAPEEPPSLNVVQRRVLVGATVLLLACIVGACLAGRSAWQSTRALSTLVAYVATEQAAPTATLPPTATATSTATATATATPTSTATAIPTATPTSTATAIPTATATATATSTAVPTWTPTPTAVYVGAVMTGSFYVRQGPGFEYDLLGMVLSRGQVIEVVAVYGDWVQARWTPQDGAEVVGWVLVRWVGSLAPFPESIITPTAVP